MQDVGACIVCVGTLRVISFISCYVFALNSRVFSFIYHHHHHHRNDLQLCLWSSTKVMTVKYVPEFFPPLETDDRMRAFAEKVFASETKDEDVREEISLFGVAECPILNQELAHHVTMDDDMERR